MKKGLITFLSAALVLNAGNLFAQQEELKVKEPGRTEFTPYNFMQIQAGAAHTRGEAKFKDLLSPAAALNFGRKFNPNFGLRFGVNGWQAKGGWVVNPKADYKYNFVQLNLDAILDISNMLNGFNPERKVGFYGFAGIAFNHAYNNDEAVEIAKQGAVMSYLWEDSKNLLVGRAGLGMDIRLCDYVNLNIEANANGMNDRFNSKKAGNIDWQFNALVGLTIKFGKDHKTTPPVYYERQPAPTPTPTPTPAPAPKVEEKPVPAQQVVKVEPMNKNIFFDLNKTVIREDQISKLTELVEYLNKYTNTKVKITGYADRQTGNAKINTRLSEGRAKVIAEYLANKGISADRITTDFKGDREQPFSNNAENRVSICIAE